MNMKTKNYGNKKIFETAGVGWTSGTTITERFPTLAPAMVISKFSLSPNLLLKSNILFKVLSIQCCFFEEGEKLNTV